jgi:hypothetical protein
MGGQVSVGEDTEKVAKTPQKGGPIMTEEKRTILEEARRVGDEIGMDWKRFDLEQLRAGMDVEFEHSARESPPISGEV